MSNIKIGDWLFDGVEYDAESDVLYLSIGEARTGYGEETPEGHVLRYDEDDRFCGVTIIGIQALLDKGETPSVTVPPKPKQEVIPRTQIHRALAAC